MEKQYVHSVPPLKKEAFNKYSTYSTFKYKVHQTQNVMSSYEGAGLQEDKVTFIPHVSSYKQTFYCVL